MPIKPPKRARKAPPKSRAKAGYKKTSDDSNTAPGMRRLSPSPNKLNAKGKRGKMTPPKQGSGQKLTKMTKPAAKKTRRQPELYR